MASHPDQYGSTVMLVAVALTRSMGFCWDGVRKREREETCSVRWSHCANVVAQVGFDVAYTDHKRERMERRDLFGKAGDRGKEVKASREVVYGRMDKKGQEYVLVIYQCQTGTDKIYTS